MVEGTLSYLNNVGQMQKNHFYRDEKFTTAAHFLFECESLKKQFDSNLYFFNIQRSSDNE